MEYEFDETDYQEERDAARADSWHDQQVDREPNSAMMPARYIEELLPLCSDQLFGQEAVEWAIVSDFVKLTYDRETDLRLIMGEPGKPETGQYDAICEHWRARCREMQEQVAEAMSPLLAEILRPVPEQEAA